MESKGFFDRHTKILISLFLATAIIAVYWQVGNHEFVNFDDNLYVTANKHVKAGLSLDSIKWAFSFAEKEKTYWHPLTWLSHMLDCQLFGVNPRWHHLMNVLFHVANTLLLFVVLKQMTGALWKSAFVASLFALHPVNVDSVAWVAERKNLLSTFFWMLTMLTYAHYCKRPNIYRYLLVFTCLGLGLLAKPMLVTLPFVLLLLDYWPLGRIQLWDQDGKPEKAIKEILLSKTVLEKIPLITLSLTSIYVSSISLRSASNVISTHIIPMGPRIENAIVSYVIYIIKAVWPHHLAVYYPFPTTIPTWEVLTSCLVLTGITTIVIWLLRKMPFLAVGWFWFIGTLIPVSGIMQAGLWPKMADRWAYVPFIGLFIMITWGVPELLNKWQYRKQTLTITAGITLSILMITTYIQLGYWKNSITLFEHAINVTTDNPIAQNNLGLALYDKGRIDDAIRHYHEALQIDPRFVKAHNNLGIALARLNKDQEAIKQYLITLKLDPAYVKAHNNLGLMLAKLGKTNQAIKEYYKAIQIKPDYASPYNNLGTLFYEQNHIEKAIKFYSKAVSINPYYATAYNNLGVALAKLGKTNQAIKQYYMAIKIKPDYADAYINLASALASEGKMEQSISIYKKTLMLKPGSAKVAAKLATIFLRHGKIDKAINLYSRALKTDPDFAYAHNNLGVALANKGELDKAIYHFREALRIKPNYGSALKNLRIVSAIREKSLKRQGRQ